MRRFLLSVSALAMATCLAGGAALADEDSTELTAWRLFVSDHADAKVTVIDALDGDVLDTLTIKGPANLFRSDSGEAVYAVQGAAGAVTAIASGIAFHDHGDHADIDVDPPKLTGAEFTGERPSHFVEHSGHWAVFFDGEGVARIFEESEALEGHVETRDVAAGAPHHGVVIPFGSHDIVSVPNPEDPSNPPIAVRILDRDGNQLGEDISCVGLHGEATSGNLVALGGCADGILIVRSGDGAPVVEPLSFTDGLPEGRVSTLIGGRGLQYFLGNHGPNAVVLIDPNEAEAFRRIELPTRRVHFAVDPVRARFAYVFTEDGQLHQIDVIHGEIEHSLRLTDPYSMDGHWSDPRPRVAVAGDNIVVTDPLNSKLHLVNASSFEKAGEIKVEGRPFNIVAVGGSGVVHGGEEGHGHDDGHAHSGENGQADDGHGHAESADGHDHDNEREEGHSHGDRHDHD
ncbi:zinc metallochaperone AztD [Afifella pfennigii]|uniref:zinc metallochaperone AztD n=1 Tax=Afifella pfennigii TaxID=209897 RepID=UPI000A9FD2F4|nr:zinc metallochaperone AztD [Afifella pfennigii]